jgi:hypothetical protein
VSSLSLFCAQTWCWPFLLQDIYLHRPASASRFPAIVMSSWSFTAVGRYRGKSCHGKNASGYSAAQSTASSSLFVVWHQCDLHISIVKCNCQVCDIAHWGGQQWQPFFQNLWPSNETSFLSGSRIV